MTPRFRFRFSLALFLGFLLTSPTRASNSWNAARQAWNGDEAKLLGKELVGNLPDRLNEVKKPDSKIRGIIQQLPEVIDKLLPVARTEGLALLSMYFFYQSFLLYDEAKILEARLKIHHGKFELLEIEMKTFRNAIETKLIPQWEAGDTTNFQKTANKLLEKFGGFFTVVQELTQAIRQDIEKSGSNQRWSCFLAVSGLVLCVGSFTARPTPNMATPPSGVNIPVLICAAAIGTAGYSWLSYTTLCDILPELERLEKAAITLGRELAKYRSELDLAKIIGEFERSTD